MFGGATFWFDLRFTSSTTPVLYPEWMENFRWTYRYLWKSVWQSTDVDHWIF